MKNTSLSSPGAVFEEIRRSGPANDVGKGRRMTRFRVKPGMTKERVGND